MMASTHTATGTTYLLDFLLVVFLVIIDIVLGCKGTKKSLKASTFQLVLSIILFFLSIRASNRLRQPIVR